MTIGCPSSYDLRLLYIQFMLQVIESHGLRVVVLDVVRCI
jgi:hypothetical protein